MSNLVNSVSGNNGFSKVENAAAHLSELNLSVGQVVNLSAEVVSTRLLNQGVAGAGTLFQVVGYAPNGFGTALQNSIVFLNNQQNSAAVTAVTDLRLLVLPVGAQVVSVVATNNGVPITGGATLDIGTEVWSAAPVSSANLFTGVATTGAGSLDLPVFNGSVVGGVAPTALGSAGSDLVGVAVVANNTGVSVEVIGASNTAGDLALTVTYLL